MLIPVNASGKRVPLYVKERALKVCSLIGQRLRLQCALRLCVSLCTRVFEELAQVIDIKPCTKTIPHPSGYGSHIVPVNGTGVSACNLDHEDKIMDPPIAISHPLCSPASRSVFFPHHGTR